MSHMIHIAALAAATVAGAAFGSEDAPHAAGLAHMAVAHDSRPLDGIIWYPAAASSPLQRVHSNPVWAGVDAAEDAAPTEGRYPLVVLSHGMYGNMMNQNWLASALAREGYIVVAISHPGTSTWARDPEDARVLWERPRDISRTIDFMLERSDMRELIDADRIYMAGHSLGGWTAVMLAGGRFDPDRFDAFCASGADPFVCNIMDRWRVAANDEDRAMIAQDYSDDRISAFAVFDLGGTQSFDTGSLGAIDASMLVIGAPDLDSGLNLDIESRALVAALPEAQVTYAEPSELSHFDFMGICTERGLAILQAEEPEDAMVCIGGADQRHGEHAEIVQAVIAQFPAQ